VIEKQAKPSKKGERIKTEKMFWGAVSHKGV
jgi:hypothetical protein